MSRPVVTPTLPAIPAPSVRDAAQGRADATLPWSGEAFEQ
jgi:hypothetical protein